MFDFYQLKNLYPLSTLLVTFLREIKMALPDIPFKAWWDEYDFPERLANQNFGNLLDEDDLRRLVFRSKFRQLVSINSGVSEVSYMKDRLVITHDTSQFKLNEIKTFVDENFIIVQAKHSEREDENESGHLLSRELTRKYPLPKNCISEKIEAYYFEDKVVITVPIHVKPSTFDIPVRDMDINKCNDLATGLDSAKEASHETLDQIDIETKQAYQDPKDNPVVNETEFAHENLFNHHQEKSTVQVRVEKLNEESEATADKTVSPVSPEEDLEVYYHFSTKEAFRKTLRQVLDSADLRFKNAQSNFIGLGAELTTEFISNVSKAETTSKVRVEMVNEELKIRGKKKASNERVPEVSEYDVVLQSDSAEEEYSSDKFQNSSPAAAVSETGEISVISCNTKEISDQADEFSIENSAKASKEISAAVEGNSKESCRENSTLKSVNERLESFKENTCEKSECKKSSDKLSADSSHISPLKRKIIRISNGGTSADVKDMKVRRIDQRKPKEKPSIKNSEEKVSQVKSKTSAEEGKDSKKDVEPKPNTRGRKSVPLKTVKGRK